jgi:hypothetical protein
MCGWTQRDCRAARAGPLVASTPPGWRRFADRNAELAALLGDPGRAG